MALDIVLSGFELELYGDDELPFVYWYAETIINRYVTVRLASSRSSCSNFQVQVVTSNTETNQCISNGRNVT